MTEQEALALMIPPGQIRPGKMGGGGIVQILLTRACTLACFGCTQGSNLGGKPTFMSLENLDTALKSLDGYWGLIAFFGGQPTLHPKFQQCCELLASRVPIEKRGLWTNALNGHGAICRRTFQPGNTNLNVHLDRKAWDEFKRDWPEAMPFGLDRDSRHSPPFVAMKDVLRTTCTRCAGSGKEDQGSPYGQPCITCSGTGQIYDESKAWELISGCDINRHWSALIGEFRGQPRAWFCEVAGAQAMLHQDEPDYPDTGCKLVDQYGTAWVRGNGSNHLDGAWWEMPMTAFVDQVRQHCHSCGVPLRGYGELSQADILEHETMTEPDRTDTIPHGRPKEQTSATHANVYKPKRKSRPVEVVTSVEQLGIGKLAKITDYIGNANR